MSYPTDLLPGNSSGDQVPLFVYGTLRRTQENYTLLRGYTLDERPAWIDGHTLYAINTYPVVAIGEHTVYGELIRLNPNVCDRVLGRLDAFERSASRPNAGALHRRLVRAQTATGHEWAWLYRAEDTRLIASGRIVPSGDWISHQLGRIAATRLHRYIDTEIQKGMR